MNDEDPNKPSDKRPLWAEGDSLDNFMEDIMTLILVAAVSGMLIAVLLT